jgi:hypothetical protein
MLLTKVFNKNTQTVVSPLVKRRRRMNSDWGKELARPTPGFETPAKRLKGLIASTG